MKEALEAHMRWEICMQMPFAVEFVERFSILQHVRQVMTNQDGEMTCSLSCVCVCVCVRV